MDFFFFTFGIVFCGYLDWSLLDLMMNVSNICKYCVYIMNVIYLETKFDVKMEQVNQIKVMN